MAINAATGYENVTKQNGVSIAVPVARWTITDAAQIDAIYRYHNAGNYFVSANDFAKTLGALNPQTTIATYAEVFNQTLKQALSKAR